MQRKLTLNRISMITGVLIVALAFFIAVYPHRSADWLFIPAFVVIAVYEFSKAALENYAGYFYVVQFGITVHAVSICQPFCVKSCSLFFVYVDFLDSQKYKKVGSKIANKEYQHNDIDIFRTDSRMAILGNVIC